MSQDDKKTTLVAEEISSDVGMSRRSALGRVAAVAAGAAVVAAGLRSTEAEAQGCTDSDGGSNADGVGRGRRCRSGCTDSDGGSNADGVGRGRRCGARRSCTDSDNGSNADGVGRGRRC